MPVNLTCTGVVADAASTSSIVIPGLPGDCPDIGGGASRKWTPRITTAELCAVVEQMYSLQHMFRVQADPAFLDRCGASGSTHARLSDITAIA